MYSRKHKRPAAGDFEHAGASQIDAQRNECGEHPATNHVDVIGSCRMMTYTIAGSRKLAISRPHFDVTPSVTSG